MIDELYIQVSTPQPVGVTGVSVNARVLNGWTDIRVTRGAERIPNDFTISTTERFPAQRAANIVQPQDVCTIFIGDDVVLTGYVDSVVSSVDNGTHTVTVSGRGRCQDLVDCSAEWPGSLINGTNALDIATKLVQPYAPLQAMLDANANVGPSIVSFPLNYGETAWDIIDRCTRAAGLLAYETPEGNLLLAALGTVSAGSGFELGTNVQKATSTYSSSERYSDYQGVAQSVNTMIETGEAGFFRPVVKDSTSIRHRLKYIVAETIGGQISQDFLDTRISWELNRRNGRSRSVKLTTDSWRDVNGALYAPNTLAHVQLPLLKIDSTQESTGKWIIGEVTYLRDGQNGTTCDVTMMPQSAYAVLPVPLVIPPPDVKSVVPIQIGQGR